MRIWGTRAEKEKVAQMYDEESCGSAGAIELRVASATVVSVADSGALVLLACQYRRHGDLETGHVLTSFPSAQPACARETENYA